MAASALAQQIDGLRTATSQQLDAKQRSQLGQFMTPLSISQFMASLFQDVSDDMRVLDPGAGVGSLTVALAERLWSEGNKPKQCNFVCYEIDELLNAHLQNTLEDVCAQSFAQGIEAHSDVKLEDFILSQARRRQQSIFDNVETSEQDFSHVIMNPPYKKISVNSDHRAALRLAGFETSNLYTGFMLLAAQRLTSGGEMVAIVPRSFCNGPYFKPFRQSFFADMALKRIHLFDKRNNAFKDDKVLQENIIIHAVKDTRPTDVLITTSRSANFEKDAETGEYVAEDMTTRVVPHETIIRPGDPNLFVHIAANDIEQGIVDRMMTLPCILSDLDLEVSTGPVVDFRLKDDLRFEPEPGAVPLLYAVHFRGNKVEWPKASKKPNAICVSEESRKWLWENEGCFVVTKRFSAKEEKRRVVASVYASELPGELVGFENHLNVYHHKQKGFDEAFAAGLSAFLNSSLVDRFFRHFNGHTQVNATDLRALRYPDKDTLTAIGRSISGQRLSQKQLDHLIEQDLEPMADQYNPLLAQQKVDDALEILKALGMPRAQQNERSALTLLALLDLTPEGSWDNLNMPLMGITPIMDYTRDQYGKEYAPNTRETFRRQTMHQFVEAGIALYNPDDPDRPVNSPKACYQISEEAIQVIQTFATEAWQTSLEKFLEGQEALAAKWAMHRQMHMVPVQIADDLEINLTPGAHSELIRDIIAEFAPRFAPASEVIYVGDTGDKVGLFREDRLAELGVTVDRHGKMPDVVLYFGERDWLLLIESVTSHGPVDPKRHNELATLFSNSRPGLVYVTAFPNRNIMGRYLPEISWETEVWCADSPTHLIHFNGERFLGPYGN